MNRSARRRQHPKPSQKAVKHRKRTIKTASAQPLASVPEQADAQGLVIVAMLPGALMYRRPNPAGVPDLHSAQSAHLHEAGATAVFANVPTPERDAIFQSLAKTLRRSTYHRLRYQELRRALDDRRKNLPGEVFWDELVETLHFELQAFCGAARTVLDELMYAVARRHGVPEVDARERPWNVADLIKNETIPKICQVPEVHLARTKPDWFHLLNSYRNTFFHHGWRHGSGHFADNDTRMAAKSPVSNALLVPDVASLRRRSKPHEWTYDGGTTIDDVMRLAAGGLDDFIRELCEGPWSTRVPPPGTVPRDSHPNIIVALARPVLMIVHNMAVIPLFTSEAAGRSFGCPQGDNAELVDIPVVTSVMGQPAVSLCMNGLDRSRLPSGLTNIRLLIDPVVNNAAWTDIDCTTDISIDLDALLANPTLPVSLPVAEFDRVFIWKDTTDRTW